MKFALFLSAIALAGCSTASRMNIVDLNHYVIDCNKRDEQLAFLQRQMPTRNERYSNAMQMTSPVGTISSIANGTYAEDRATFDRKQEATARVIIYQIEAYCPTPKPKPQGCTTVLEQMPSGASQGTRCYRGTNPKPVINKWEALVDR